MEKTRAPRNRTLTVSKHDMSRLRKKLIIPENNRLNTEQILNKTICGDLFSVLDILPDNFVDLLILDPPYNLDKNFNGLKFSKSGDDEYIEYLNSWFPKVLKTLKTTGSVYICGDWKSTFGLYTVMRDNLIIRNRIIWQREKRKRSKIKLEKFF